MSLEYNTGTPITCRDSLCIFKCDFCRLLVLFGAHTIIINISEFNSCNWVVSLLSEKDGKIVIFCLHVVQALKKNFFSLTWISICCDQQYKVPMSSGFRGIAMRHIYNEPFTPGWRELPYMSVIVAYYHLPQGRIFRKIWLPSFT